MRALLSTALFALLAGPATTALGGEGSPVPDYAASVEAFQAQRKPMDISPADRAVMQQAQEDLARAMPDPGLKVGERAPDFTLPNALGEAVTLSKQLQDGPVVLAFYRGAWCPYCNLELKALKESLPHFEAAGASLIAVTPQRPDKSLEQVKKDGYPFEILSDLDDSVMKAYDLYFEVPPDLNEVYQRNFGLDIAAYNGEGRYVLPVPGTFVIDRDGIVRAAFADVDYKRRMEPRDILAALRALDDTRGEGG